MTWQRNRLTRLGVHFLFVGSFALIGGALRGFNLLLILAGLVVGVLIVHWRWSRRSMEDLSVKRRLPMEAFAEKPFRIGYQVQSTSRFFPSWMLCIEDCVSPQKRAIGTHGRWSRLVHRSPFASKLVNATLVCGLGFIPPRKMRAAYSDCTITNRGLYELGPIQLVSCFPFALITARKTIPITENLYVLPKLLPLKKNWNRGLTSVVGSDIDSAKRSGGERGEFFGLREWQSGDSTQLIHWRTSARTGVPAVRQFEQKRSFDVCLLLDAFSQQKPTLTKFQSEGLVASDELLPNEFMFEKAVSLTASLLCQMQKMPSSHFVLAVAEAVTNVLPGNSTRGSSELSKQRMLRLLAQTNAVERPKLCEALTEAFQSGGRRQDLVIVSTRSMSDAIRCEPELKEAIAVWNRQNVLRWIDVRSSDFERFVADKNNGRKNRESSDG
jgi:uncharacterized protein (DUF58 family)